MREHTGVAFCGLRHRAGVRDTSHTLTLVVWLDEQEQKPRDRMVLLYSTARYASERHGRTHCNRTR